MKPFIRKANHNDLDNIRQCAIAAYSLYIKRIGKDPAPMIADFATAISNDTVFIILLDSKFAGFVIFFQRGDHLHLENIAVEPNFQGKKLGYSLINFVETSALEQGLVAVELYTNAKMYENLILYPRLGYIKTAEYVENGFERVYFRKELR